MTYPYAQAFEGALIWTRLGAKVIKDGFITHWNQSSSSFLLSSLELSDTVRALQLSMAGAGVFHFSAPPPSALPYLDAMHESGIQASEGGRILTRRGAKLAKNGFFCKFCSESRLFLQVLLRDPFERMAGAGISHFSAPPPSALQRNIGLRRV